MKDETGSAWAGRSSDTQSVREAGRKVWQMDPCPASMKPQAAHEARTTVEGSRHRSRCRKSVQLAGVATSQIAPYDVRMLGKLDNDILVHSMPETTPG